jgi:hypothetical protein
MRTDLSVLLLGWGIVPLLDALGFDMISQETRDSLLRVRASFWRSVVGERVATGLRWVADRLGRRRVKSIGEFRGTEVAVGAAIMDLVDALPRAYRANLGDVGAVVRRLESRAGEARQQLARLHQVAAAAGGSAGEIDPAREAARRELADSVSALESIRLGLLRLHGGATDLRPMTTVLDAARGVLSDVGRLREAEWEVEDIVGPRAELYEADVDSRPLTPV